MIFITYIQILERDKTRGKINNLTIKSLECFIYNVHHEGLTKNISIILKINNFV